MAGLNPAVVGMIAASLYSIGRQVLFPHGLAIASGDVVQLFCALCINYLYVGGRRRGVWVRAAFAGMIFVFTICSYFIRRFITNACYD